ncbi:MAG: hypothetical protein ACE37H_04825 [Phycisphaeraceae bacterium]
MSKELERIIAQISRHGGAGRLMARHDAASLINSYSTSPVRNCREFDDRIGKFVNQQARMTGGTVYPDFEARAIAKDILKEQGKRFRKTYANYARDAIDGSGEGLYGVLKILADYLRDHQIDRFQNDAIDRLVDPLSFQDQVAITKAIMEKHNKTSVADIGDPSPEAHAHAYRDLVREQARHSDEMSDKMRGH